ncbi:MAG: sugar nucleotide-binding protein [Acidobacteria bacterium]|nr:sugar nucleotide-binding protein [Acidobacteriota bacterium]
MKGSSSQKVLVIGASSYLGSRLLQALGDRAVGTFNSRPASNCIFFDATRMRLSEVLHLDAGFSHAVICYAITRIDDCKADVKRSQVVNVESVKILIDELTHHEIKPVFMSSEYVFDGCRGNYTEEDKPLPNTVYGRQKLEMEEYIGRRCERFAILRLAKVFSADANDDTILASWFRQILKGEEIRCAYDQIFSPICVTNVVQCVQAVINLGLNGVFHVSGHEAWSRLGMLKVFLDQLGMRTPVIECSIGDFEFLDNRPLDLSMSSEKIRGATGLSFRSVLDCCTEFSETFGGLRAKGVVII